MSDKQAGWDRINALVVDDNRHMRSVVKQILYTVNIRNVVEAADGAEALKQMRTFSADLVVCDWNMTPLDGIDFVRLIRQAKDSPNPFVSIIMLTGHTEMHRIYEARDAGVNEFLAKPISAQALLARVRAVIEFPRAFVRCKTYFGPDRRRKQIPFRGEERRKGPPDPRE